MPYNALMELTTPPEIWKPVPSYEGYYSVSNLGRVRRDMACRGARAGRVFTGAQDPGGYLALRLARQRVNKRVLVHRVVCEAFHGPPPPGRNWVNHKDGVRANNRADNLEWCSPRENAEHAWRTLKRPPVHNPNTAAAETVAEIIRRVSAGESRKSVAAALGVSEMTVGKYWNTHAYPEGGRPVRSRRPALPARAKQPNVGYVPRRLTPDGLARAQALKAAGWSVPAIATDLGVHRSSIWRLFNDADASLTRVHAAVSLPGAPTVEAPVPPPLPLLEGEEARPVEGYPAYAVSSFGRVFRVKGGRGSRRGLLAGSVISSGYEKVSFSVDGVSTGHLIHRLVCRAFHGPAPEGKDVVNHKDGNKRNNKASNLEWVSHAENAAHAATLP